MVSDNPDKRLLQIQAARNIKLMNQLMKQIQNDIHQTAENSENIEQFKENIAFYTNINCFTSNKYREQTQKVVQSINQVLKTNSK